MTKDPQGKKIRVHFDPDNIDILVSPGENLLQAARQAGARLYAACGGDGTCGTCKVIVQKGEVETIRTRHLSDEEFNQGVRQACQTRVLSDVSVYIPVESRLERAVLARERKVAAEVVATGWRYRPPLTKYYVELPPPTMEDNTSDLSRLLRGLKQQCHLSNLAVDFRVLKKLAETLRKKDWRATVTTLTKAVRTKDERRRPTVINVEAGNTTDRHYSLAFDIGTTTVCGQLLDLNRGAVIADSIAYNGQIKYGADVISRINYSQKAGGLKDLQKAVVTTVNQVIDELLEQSKVNRRDIGHLMLAGNTTMTQIIMGLDPKYIRLAPYTPVAHFFPPVEAKSLGIKLNDHVHLFAFPAVSSYVGGDIVSGVIGCGMHQRKALTLFIDIGTNGEIVIGNSDWMVTASCSAGPAFEGGNIRHGIIATEGAIQDFSIDPATFEPTIATIGGTKPKGICGSGLINTIAGLLETGAIGQNGKFNHDLPTKRVRPGEDGYEYVLAWAPETQIGRDIVITEVDIDNLVRAKGAMYAGYQTLSKSVGLDCCANFEQVIIAGAFGSHLNIEKSITIGLLPDIPVERFTFIGNGSLMGARLTSFSVDLLDDARRVAQMMTNVEFAENVNFMNNFIAAIFLPHTNASEFPTVSKKLAKLTAGKQRITT
jgi:uncharacterized 2Fe-2S/4Fe-4S cluster protein (DUF4445 family)